MVQALKQYITISYSASDFVVYVFQLLSCSFVCWFCCCLFFKENLSHRWICPWILLVFSCFTLCAKFINGTWEANLWHLRILIYIFCFVSVFIFLMSFHHCAYSRIIRTWELPGTLTGFLSFSQWPEWFPFFSTRQCKLWK